MFKSFRPKDSRGKTGLSDRLRPLSQSRLPPDKHNFFLIFYKFEQTKHSEHFLCISVTYPKKAKTIYNHTPFSLTGQEF